MANGGLGSLSATLHQYTRAAAPPTSAGPGGGQGSAQRRRQVQVLPATPHGVGRDWTSWDVVGWAGTMWDEGESDGTQYYARWT